MPSDDFLPQPVNDHEPTDLPSKHGLVRQMLGKVLEAVNPLEAVFEIFSDHEATAGVLVFIAAAAVVILLVTGIWSVVQEIFIGGGPPQGLGLN